MAPFDNTVEAEAVSGTTPTFRIHDAVMLIAPRDFAQIERMFVSDRYHMPQVRRAGHEPRYHWKAPETAQAYRDVLEWLKAGGLPTEKVPLRFYFDEPTVTEQYGTKCGCAGAAIGYLLGGSGHFAEAPCESQYSFEWLFCGANHRGSIHQVINRMETYMRRVGFLPVAE